MTDPINCEEAQALLTRGAQLVDVRTPGEYAAGALPGASKSAGGGNLPVGESPRPRETGAALLP